MTTLQNTNTVEAVNGIFYSTCTIADLLCAPGRRVVFVQSS